MSKLELIWRRLGRAYACLVRDDSSDLEALLKHSADAIIVVGLNRTISRFNPTAERLYLYSAAEMIGKPLGILGDESLIGSESDFLDRVLAGERITSFRTPARRADGEQMYVAISGSPVVEPSGQIIGAYAVIRNVSDVARQQLELGRAEEQLRRMFDDSLIGMAITDLDGRFQRVNETLCKILERSEQELVGSTFDDLYNRDDDGASQRLLHSGARDRYVVERRFVQRDGSILWVEIAVNPHRDSDGQPFQYSIEALDITQRRADEERLRQLADHDSLTGALNRRGFMHELRAHVAHVTRYGAIGATLMIDLDNFKHLNDTRGHAVGDQMLKLVAEAISIRVRESDFFARLGGDEFAVLLPEATADEALNVAQALLAQVAHAADEFADSKHPLTATIGIATFTYDGVPSAEGALICADRAMYAAKTAGKNRVAVYDSATREIAVRI